MSNANSGKASVNNVALDCGKAVAIVIAALIVITCVIGWPLANRELVLSTGSAGIAWITVSGRGFWHAAIWWAISFALVAWCTCVFATLVQSQSARDPGLSLKPRPSSVPQLASALVAVLGFLFAVAPGLVALCSFDADFISAYAMTFRVMAIFATVIFFVATCLVLGDALDESMAETDDERDELQGL